MQIHFIGGRHRLTSPRLTIRARKVEGEQRREQAYRPCAPMGGGQRPERCRDNAPALDVGLGNEAPRNGSASRPARKAIMRQVRR